MKGGSKWKRAEATKEYDLVKPENLKIIGSSRYMNKAMTDYFKTFDFIDNIFTVYDVDNVEINCGGLSCKECGYKCYKGNHSSYGINEFIK